MNRKPLEDFLKAHGFQESTLAMLNDEHLQQLAKDYGYNA